MQQNQLIIKTYQEQLPAVVTNQLDSTGPVQTVKTQKSLVLIKNAINEIQQPLAIAATALEISSAIKKLFVLLQKPNSNAEKEKVEIAEYIKMLQGQPLWAVEKAVEKVCKEHSFRDFSKLFAEIKALIEPEVKKIERLKNIYKASVKEMEAEAALKKAMDECPSLESALKQAAENGNKFANYIIINKKLKVDNAVKDYQNCNTLAQDFLNKNNINN